MNAVEIVLIIYKTRVMMSMVLMLMLMLARADIHLQQTFPTVPPLICSSSGQLIYDNDDGDNADNGYHDDDESSGQDLIMVKC